jgi:DNA polymerase III epsilon subunit-like protein
MTNYKKYDNNFIDLQKRKKDKKDKIKILWIDTETTGLKWTDKIIEIAAVYHNKNEKIQFHKYIKYDNYPDTFEEAAKIHKITKEFLKEKGETPAEVYKQFLKFLDSKVDKFNKSDKMIIAGHNVDFDKDFLYKFFKLHNNDFFNSYFHGTTLDTQRIITLFIVNRIIEMPENFKLVTIADKFGIDFNAHNALEDIKATMKIYEQLLKIFIENA